MANFENRIVFNPKVLSGKPVIKGTRVPVYVVLGSLASGMDFKEITNEYGIEFQDIQACLNYATDVVVSEEAYPLLKKAK